MATYACPKCGAPCLSEAAAYAHCAKQTCSNCNGKGYLPGGVGYGSQRCPCCHGSGKL